MEEGKKYYAVRSYADFRHKALEDIEGFWAKEAESLPWFRRWDRTLNWNEPLAKWFEGGNAMTHLGSGN